MLPVNMVQLAPAGDNRNYAIWFAKHILKAIQIYKLFFFFFQSGKRDMNGMMGQYFWYM